MISNYYIGAGVGEGKSRLTSFDSALLSSGMGNYNLLKVSSILPPNCQFRSEITVPRGQLIYVAYASIMSNLRGKTIAAAVGVGIPENDNNVGVIMEYSGVCDKFFAEEQVYRMVREAMLKRKMMIKDFKCVSGESVVENDKYFSAFAGIAMW